jgi:hypothetical protein
MVAAHYRGIDTIARQALFPDYRSGAGMNLRR